MKKISWLILLLGIPFSKLRSQDVPLYSQRLTNSFIFNPSVAGNEFGSLTFSHRTFWSGIDDASASNLLSVHTPFGGHRYGTGLNVFQERIGVFDRLYASGAFAYHIRMSRSTSLSMGVSAEFNNLQVNTAQIDVTDNSDPLLFGNDADRQSTDFSFGINLSTKYFDLGGSANRLTSGFGIADESNQLSGFYTGYFNGKVPIAYGRDILEPIAVYRQLSPESYQFDAGLYYTFNNSVTLGGSYRSSGQLTATAALRIAQKVLIGYSYETQSDDFRSALGNSNEITLRFDFSNYNYQDRFKEDYKNALAFRRKTLSSAVKRGRSVGARSPAELAKRKRRLKFAKSPNERYAKYKRSKRKKFNSAKRKKQNYRRTKQRRKSYARRRR
ncbi:MAG: PorP/SprF family type IX secretion system membrane protein [Bacteroidota bacterium]